MNGTPDGRNAAKIEVAEPDKATADSRGQKGLGKNTRDEFKGGGRHGHLWI